MDGAPLQIIDDPARCVYRILGISHITATFGLKDVPFVFTRIYPYLEWIEQKVWLH